MWIFTKNGFFSAVCARQGTGKHGQPLDLDRINEENTKTTLIQPILGGLSSDVERRTRKLLSLQVPLGDILYLTNSRNKRFKSQ